MQRILFIFGTRPEAIKLCPLVHELRRRPADFEVSVCVTAQHRGMLDQVLSVFNVQPDYDLDVMRAGQTLTGLTARILAALEEQVLRDFRPDAVIVQGDTTTTFAGALAAFYERIPICHVEAGLRTGDMEQPFPEEMNRVLTGRLATLHFAPTATSSENLLGEGVEPARISITGNTGIDAVMYMRDALESGTLPPGALPDNAWPRLDPRRRLIVVTSHRRENFGPGFARVMNALLRIADRDDVEIVYPVHRNPNVLGPAHEILGNRPNIHMIEPLSYVPFVDLMRRAAFLATDSGGIQEEAPSLGKPVLVFREKTERPEAVTAGTVKLVGTDEDLIVSEASRLLDDAGEYQRMTRIHNPYGDGKASARIADAMAAYFEKPKGTAPA